MDDVTFSAESRSLWVMSYVIGGFVIGDEDCTANSMLFKCLHDQIVFNIIFETTTIADT